MRVSTWAIASEPSTIAGMPGYGGSVVCMSPASARRRVRAGARWPEGACRMALRPASARAPASLGCAFRLAESGSVGPPFPPRRRRDSPRHAPHEAGMNAVNTAWNELPNGAKAFRVAHGAYSVVGLGSLATIWWSAASRRRNRLVRGAVLFLLAEGGALIGGRGNCPFGPFQASLGDPVP